MTLNQIRSMALAAITCVCIAAPAAAGAQRYPQDRDRDYRNDYRYGVRDVVSRVERESNAFRDYFEHNFRDRGNAKRNDRWDSHADHQNRYGNMTLKDAIQNLDEAMERLRNAVNRGNNRSRDISENLDDVMEHVRDVDSRIGRISDTYDFSGGYRYGSGRYGDVFGRYNNRSWRNDRSDLGTLWRDLRSDINDMARQLGGRGRF